MNSFVILVQCRTKVVHGVTVRNGGSYRAIGGGLHAFFAATGAQIFHTSIQVVIYAVTSSHALIAAASLQVISTFGC